MGVGEGECLFCSEGFFHPLYASSNLESEAPVVGGRGCLDSSHSACAPLFHPSKELVVQKGWRLPEYTVTQESGPAHRKEFTMTCRVERFIEIGNWAEGSFCSYCSPALQSWPQAAPSFSVLQPHSSG